jgi:tetratricopeptide (TPR) repeat protein
MKLGLGILVLIIAASPLAVAGPREEAAKESTKKGTAAYNLGSYDEAAKNYEEAYRLIQKPELLFNIGQSWRQAGKADKALTAYKSFLRTAPPEADNREQVERRVAELEKINSDMKEAQSAPPTGTMSGPTPPLPEPIPMVSKTSEPDQAIVEDSPFYSRWYFWAGTAAVVAGAVATAVLLSSGDSRSTTCGAGVDFCSPVPR